MCHFNLDICHRNYFAENIFQTHKHRSVFRRSIKCDVILSVLSFEGRLDDFIIGLQFNDEQIISINLSKKKHASKTNIVHKIT